MSGFWANSLRTRLFRKPLPRLLVIGDSISVHYAPYLEKFLQGRFECLKREGGDAALANLDVPLGANWGDSSMVLERLGHSRLLEAARADLALVNCGLHDIKRHNREAECQIPPGLYRENLERIADLFARTKTRLIWVSTTPVYDERHAQWMKEFVRFNRDVMVCNGMVEEVMKHGGVPVIDLYGFTKGLGSDIFVDHVHFTEKARKQQAQFIADWLLANPFIAD